MTKKYKHKIKKAYSKIYKFFEDAFIPGTYKSFLLHDFLFVSNVFLTILMLVELFMIFVLKIPTEEIHFFHRIDLTFGIIFLIEAIIRMIYVYIPNRIFFKPHIIINWIVIISLVWPDLFFNLAFLRLVRSFKVLKIYIYKKEKREDRKDGYLGILEIIFYAFKYFYHFTKRLILDFFAYLEFLIKKYFFKK